MQKKRKARGEERQKNAYGFVINLCGLNLIIILKEADSKYSQREREEERKKRAEYDNNMSVGVKKGNVKSTKMIIN